MAVKEGRHHTAVDDTCRPRSEATTRTAVRGGKEVTQTATAPDSGRPQKRAAGRSAMKLPRLILPQQGPATNGSPGMVQMHCEIAGQKLHKSLDKCTRRDGAVLQASSSSLVAPNPTHSTSGETTNNWPASPSQHMSADALTWEDAVDLSAQHFTPFNPSHSKLGCTHLPPTP